MIASLRSRFSPYAYALLLTLVALILTLAIRQLFHVHNLYVLFASSVVISASWFGVRAGLLSTALGALVSNYFLIEPLYSFDFDDPYDSYFLALFVLEGALGSVLAANLGSSGRRLLDRPLLAYPLAAGMVAVAVMFKLSLGRALPFFPEFSQSTPYMMFYLVIVFSAWEGGMGPSFLATVLAALSATYFFLSPPYQLRIGNPQEVLRLTFFLAEGTLIGLVSTTIHSARRQAADNARRAQDFHERLQESERRYRLLVAGVKDHAIFLLDTQGLVLTWDSGAETVLGYSAAEAMQRPFQVFFTPEEQQAHRPEEEVATALREGRYNTARWWVRRGGERFWGDLYLAAVNDREGKLYGVAVVLRDLTQQQQLEENLRQAQKMEAVGRLAAGVAHDFNNMLAAVLGYSELMLRKLPSDDPFRTDLTAVIEIGERTAVLTRQLLAFSRKKTVQPRLVDLNGIVVTACKLLRRLIGEDLELVTALSPDVSLVQADPGQFEQVLVNLAVNGRDAMPTGGKLTMETCNLSLGEGSAGLHPGIRPGQYVLLTVSDTGCGMSDEVKSHLFEPFFTTKEVGKGTGLGLATVGSIVKEMGGHIAVSSAVGRGTSFKIYVPATSAGVESSPAAQAQQAPRGTETVLLVEDEDLLRTLYQRMLEGQGYKVLTARNGSEAFQIHASHSGLIHLLVTDVVMPKMTGCELAGRLLGVQPTLKVLYISGYADEVLARHGLRQTEVTFLQKPFSSDGLARKVRETLDQ